MWLTYDEVSAALEKFRGFYQNEYVDFMGGEPTLHPKVVEIVRHAAFIGLKPTIVTHGMRLAQEAFAAKLADAGINDFLVSIHGVGATVDRIHGRGSGHHERQVRALEVLRELGIPFRFNVTVIRDNLSELCEIVELAHTHGASVVNFLTFNPYFEWRTRGEIEFQVQHSEAAEYLMPAVDRCVAYGIEANVRYMPICQLPGYEHHVYTGYQLPYDHHEWDYNSWYDAGHPGRPDREWYLKASGRQKARHDYVHVDECGSCAVRNICDGFHEQYVARWRDDVGAAPYGGPMITDPQHFVARQAKMRCVFESADTEPDRARSGDLRSTQFEPAIDRAGIRRSG